MPLTIGETDLHILTMRSRMPFRYGVATLTALPHLFVRVELEVDGRRQAGIAAEGLAPKWFTKLDAFCRLTIMPFARALRTNTLGVRLGDLHRALECGYAGTSHKNCKGILKGIANACLLEQRRREDPNGRYLLSGEDLAIVGPVTLLQDLALMANLGVSHVERNGHHYFTGLSMHPEDVQAQVLAAHGDLYQRHERGYATLNIHNGMVETGSIVDAPVGHGFALDPARFTKREQWDVRSLDLE